MRTLNAHARTAQPSVANISASACANRGKAPPRDSLRAAHPALAVDDHLAVPGHLGHPARQFRERHHRGVLPLRSGPQQAVVGLAGEKLGVDFLGATLLTILIVPSSKQIASTFGISHRTVEIHRARLLRKYGAESTDDLVEKLIRAGR